MHLWFDLACGAERANGVSRQKECPRGTGDRIISKSSDSSSERALATFIARKAEIARIQGASADHFNAKPNEVHWGHAGILGHVAEKLREVAEFLDI